MDYRLELKPSVVKKGQKYKTIYITDLQLHTTNKTPTPSVGKKVQKAFDADKPDRIYSKIDKNAISDDHALTIELLKMDPDFVKMVQEEEAKGYKIRIAIPNEGVPIIPGRDTIEFMNSKNGKRVIRGLAKEKDKE